MESLPQFLVIKRSKKFTLEGGESIRKRGWFCWNGVKTASLNIAGYGMEFIGMLMVAWCTI